MFLHGAGMDHSMFEGQATALHEAGTGNIAAAMPAWAEAEGVQERVIAGAGHVVTLDAPEASTTAILAGVGEVLARSGG